MWLFRHTARTFLFYCVGIMATVYLGLMWEQSDPYAYLIYSVAGYGSAHLLVYLYESRSMWVLSRICTYYRDEKRASTTIFTLAFISCHVGAILAIFRLELTASLVMLGIMAAVFLAWAFVWLRGEMLFPAVFMVTLAILAVWHNKVQPTDWDPMRLIVNAATMTASALFWLMVGNRLHAVRGEVYELAGPARWCSVVLALVGTGFAAALAMSPAFPGDVWRADRAVLEWLLGMGSLVGLVGYYTWARFVLERRFFDIMGAVALLLVGLYVGLYAGVRV
jgi:hypothetical protein